MILHLIFAMSSQKHIKTAGDAFAIQANLDNSFATVLLIFGEFSHKPYASEIIFVKTLYPTFKALRNVSPLVEENLPHYSKNHS